MGSAWAEHKPPYTYDLAAFFGTGNLGVTVQASLDGRPVGSGLGSSRAVMWLQNRNNTFGQQNATKNASARPQLNAINDLQIDLNAVLSDRALVGECTAIFTDTASGVSAEPQSLDCPEDCKLPVPAFTTDIAVALTLKTDDRNSLDDTGLLPVRSGEIILIVLGVIVSLGICAAIIVRRWVMSGIARM